MITRRTALATLAATTLPGSLTFAQEASLVTEMSMGNPDSAVTVIEYASFTCPHCANFHKYAFKNLKADYIDTAKINFIYREVYFDRFGLWAGMMARCDGPEKYFGVVDMLYTRQSEWARGTDNAEIVANMRTIGLLTGMTNEKLDACFADEAKAKAMVAEFQKNSEADNVTSTPSFVINGEMHSNMSYTEMQGILDGLLDS